MKDYTIHILACEKRIIDMSVILGTSLFRSADHKVATHIVSYEWSYLQFTKDLCGIMKNICFILKYLCKYYRMMSRFDAYPKTIIEMFRYRIIILDVDLVVYKWQVAISEMNECINVVV